MARVDRLREYGLGGQAESAQRIFFLTGFKGLRFFTTENAKSTEKNAVSLLDEEQHLELDL
jgi:hypothetical protein